MVKKGTVTQLSSMFPPEEAQKASQRVQEAIGERQQQLNQLKCFADDNSSLINLVQKLPDETHHNIMVPFGKAAFFPGRLIHTNEFMVLLGEGYYAERTSKQTVEILRRRGRALETQVESLKAIMQDLKAEASFFDATAGESAEGLVEIREDYVEEDSFKTSAGCKKTNSTLQGNSRKAADEDEEYMRIQMRLDQLEKEEEEEEAKRGGWPNEDEQIQNEPDSTISQNSIEQEVRSSSIEASEVFAVSKDGSSHADYLEHNSTMSNALEVPQAEEQVETPTASNTTLIGNIVEHTYPVKQQTGARGSKPISRFKMQRSR
ncbi:hypothetical protein OROGR_000061 [Orobanche gracilis]